MGAFVTELICQPINCPPRIAENYYARVLFLDL